MNLPNVAKAGVRMLTKNAAGYCDDQMYLIRVNTLNPGTIKTPLLESVMKVGNLEEMKKHNLLGTPSDIAKVAAFLVMTQSSVQAVILILGRWWHMCSKYSS